MIVQTIFGILIVGAALLAALSRDLKQALLALWGAGLAAGGLYLYLGAEFLAVIQWILSTVITISLLFSAILFGEFREEGLRDGPKFSWKVLLMGLPLGLGFAIGVLLGVEGSGLTTPAEVGGGTLRALGRVLQDEHLLALEIVPIILFLFLIGAGVVARPEKEDS